MNILVSADKKYIMSTAVLLRSLLCHTREELATHVSDSELSDKEILKLKSLVYNMRMKEVLIKMDNTMFDKLLVSGHVSKATYFRVIVYRYIPLLINRILYLDGDIIINKDISDFYNTNFDHNTLIACKDSVLSHKILRIYKNLSMNFQESYFNSGILLFNFESIRNDRKFESKLIQCIDMYGDKLILHDQDILNLIFKNNVKFLDYKKNNSRTKDMKSKAEIKDCYENTCIFHYADKLKPWDYKYKWKFNHLYWKYANLKDYQISFKKFKNKHFVYSLIPFYFIRNLKLKLEYLIDSVIQ